jgi:hypothetical protein
MLLALLEDSETIEEFEDPPAATSDAEVLGELYSQSQLILHQIFHFINDWVCK